MGKRIKADPDPVGDHLIKHPTAEIILPGEQPLAGLTYDEVIETMVENINQVFISNDCTLADAKVAVDAFKDQLLAMTSQAEGPRAAQELAFQFMQGCLPYIFNPELDEDPRGSFKSILDSVRDNLLRGMNNGSEAESPA